MSVWLILFGENFSVVLFVRIIFVHSCKVNLLTCRYNERFQCLLRDFTARFSDICSIYRQVRLNPCAVVATILIVVTLFTTRHAKLSWSIMLPLSSGGSASGRIFGGVSTHCRKMFCIFCQLLTKIKSSM